MSTSVPEDDRAPQSPGANAGGRLADAPGWARGVIFGAAALALLLVGATIGVLIGRESAATGREPVPSGVDIGFSQDMSVHHLQAVTMGNWVRDHSNDPAVRQLGFDIASTQQGQVGQMEGWLTLWDAPLQATGDYMTWMPQGHHHGGTPMSAPTSGAPMPGMATTEELKKLRSLSGKQLDVYFLQLMLRHHMGGVAMAEYGAENAEVAAVRRLAQSMIESQGAEMDMMKEMLAERGAKPLPF